MINTIHFGIFSILPFLKKKKKVVNKSRKMHKFIILIAARNEEMVLGNLIDSLQKVDYPSELYQICVIPNNCSDNTQKIAANKNCLVIEPETNVKTKGEVLNYCFQYFKDNEFDAYIIFDADNIVSKDFLKEINNKLNEGYKIVQGFRDTKNLYENHISGSFGLFFYLQNLFLYESRHRIGKNATINGTGYAVMKNYINELPKFKTVTEDVELTCLTVLHDEKIGYAKKAIFYDEQVTDFKVSIIQRKRWIQGFIQVYKIYFKDLLTKIIHKPSFETIDFYHILYLPINQVFAILLLIISIFTIIPLKFLIITLILGYLGEILIGIYLIKYYHKKINKLWKTILFFPIFNISWIPIYIYSFFNSKNKWEEIKHTKDLKIEELERELMK